MHGSSALAWPLRSYACSRFIPFQSHFSRRPQAMRKLAGFVATFSLGVAAVVAAPAMAPNPAAATVDLSVGTQVFDSEGAVLGTVSSAQGANVVVDLGAGKQVTRQIGREQV